jgi:hypothetical protein
MPERFGRIDEEFLFNQKTGPTKTNIRRTYATWKPESDAAMKPVN